MDNVQLATDTKAAIIVEKLKQVERAWYSQQVDVTVARACEDEQMEQRAKDNMRQLQRRKDALNDLLIDLEVDDEPTA